MAFVFFDAETTGTTHAFDQIVQFAAIRTDHQLTELGRFNVRSRLLPHVVPSPEALTKNRLTPAQLTDPNLPSHYAMMREIQRQLLSWSPSIFLGYNSLGFDEHLLRYALYKTLHPPYLTNTNRNSRTDVLRMARATTIFSPGVLSIPTKGFGQMVFDLPSLAAANGFAAHSAHDAASDVEAALHIARVIMNEAPMLWSTFMRFAQKSAVVDFTRDEAIFNWTEFYSGRAYSWLVTCLGPSPGVPTELIVYDLQIDPGQLIALGDYELALRLQEQPKPLKRIKSNSGPIIGLAEDAPDIAVARHLGPAELERRLRIVRETPGFVQRLVSAFESVRTIYEPATHVEQQLYNGTFSSNEDVALMEAFHQAAWQDRSAILMRIADPRVRALGQELIYLEAPHVLPEHVRQQHRAAHVRRIMGEDGARDCTTLPNAIRELEGRISGCDPSEYPFLSDHHNFLRLWLSQAVTRAA